MLSRYENKVCSRNIFDKNNYLCDINFYVYCITFSLAQAFTPGDWKVVVFNFPTSPFRGGIFFIIWTIMIHPLKGTK